LHCIINTIIQRHSDHWEMVKSMISLLFFAAPLMAIRLNPNPIKRETIKEVDDLDSAEHVMRKIGKSNNHAWITFVGDSNMRNTYWWWVTAKLNKTGVKLLHSKQFGYKMDDRDKLIHDPHLNAEWSDQEAVLEYPDGFEVRTSFRFLHGSDHEFKFKTASWNSASRSSSMDAIADNDKKMDRVKFNAVEKEQLSDVMDDPDAIAPSQYAKWATQHQKFIDFKKDVPFLARRFTKYENAKPDVVILTEGWGGIPGCDRFDEVRDMFKKNPEVKFVWSPIYMTNRIEKRHQCFSDKMAATPQQADEAHNFKFVDMWDLAKEYPQTRVAHGTEGSKHMHLGGDYMKTAVKRFEDAIDDLAN